VLAQGFKQHFINFQGNAGFMHAFVATLSVIVVSELGDKTFFISAIMSMRHSRVVVFAGAMSALALMHVMSGKVPPSRCPLAMICMKLSDIILVEDYLHISWKAKIMHQEIR